LKEEALDRTVWRAGFGTGFGPVVRQTAKLMNTTWTERNTMNIKRIVTHYNHWALVKRKEKFPLGFVSETA